MKKDFKITTGGLDAIKTFISIYIAIIVAVCIIAAVEMIHDGNKEMAMIIIGLAFFIALPVIIFRSLIAMLIDYMYNIQEQSKILYDTNITNKKILNELQIMNSYSEEKVQV